MDADSPKKLWTRAEVAAHNTMQSAIIIIDNMVYNVTEFFEEHPGGAEVLLDNAGKDASSCFHEVGHSEIAIEWRSKFFVGELVPEDHKPIEKRKPPPEPPSEELTLATMLSVCGPPALLAVLAYILYVYIF